MGRMFAILIFAFGYSAASAKGYVPNMWEPVYAKLIAPE
jgi:hypothetical protein